MDVLCIPVGPFQTNSYILMCDQGHSVLVDPGAEPATLLAALARTEPVAILLTHGHPDHVGALLDVREATGAPIGIHPADAQLLPVQPDFNLSDGQRLVLGLCQVRVHHLPGHTPGSVAFELPGNRFLVGDTIFPGGPGHTDSPAQFAQLIRTLWERIFVLPLETQLLPGHGQHTLVGREYEPFHRFLERGWAEDAYGDVEWNTKPGPPWSAMGNA